MADDRPSNELEPRQPTLEDLRDLCRELNQRGAKYVVIGGFAIRAANYNRATMVVDLIVLPIWKTRRKFFCSLNSARQRRARTSTRRIATPQRHSRRR